MKRMNLFVSALPVLLGPFILLAGEFPEYPCYKLTEEPKMDGKMEENAWSNIPSATGFLIFPRGDYVISKQTEFKAGWTEKALYFTVRAEEPEPGKMIASASDGVQVCSSDSLEIFLHPQKLDYFFQFMVSAIGHKWNGIHSVGFGVLPAPPVWNWEAKTCAEKDFWSLEVKIPFSITGIPEGEEIWRVNVARNILSGPPAERYTTWAPVKAGFDDLKKFGSFVFKPKVLSPGEAREMEHRLNWPQKRIGETAAMYPQFKETVEQSSGLKSQAEKVLLLKQDWESITEIAGEKAPSREKISAGFQKTAGILERTTELKTMKAMRDLLEE